MRDVVVRFAYYIHVYETIKKLVYNLQIIYVMVLVRFLIRRDSFYTGDGSHIYTYIVWVNFYCYLLLRFLSCLRAQEKMSSTRDLYTNR